MKKVMVISLGGSIIIPDKIDIPLLKKFKKVLQSNYPKYKFVVVCGGGAIARKYISLLKAEKKNRREISLAGIRATRMNASTMIQFFGKEANDYIPTSMNSISNLLKKNSVVFCGALRYAENETSDGTAAKLANYFNTEFINVTNIDGLYDKNPAKYKSAKFIPSIPWLKFEEMALKIKFAPGQHFVLDQNAATLIRKKKIKSYITGKNMKDLDNILNRKKFRGTIING